MRRMAWQRRLAVAGAFALVVGMASACSSDESSSASDGGTSASTGSTGSAGGDVAVTLQEFAVAAAPGSVPAGTVTFNVENIGPNDVHEFVVIKTDLGPTELPVDANGVVDEEGEGIEPVDEIEDIEVGATPSLTVDLAAGNYALICNIWSEDEQEAHYSEGMRIGFTVE